jgi:hypothetical protein
MTRASRHSTIQVAPASLRLRSQAPPAVVRASRPRQALLTMSFARNLPTQLRSGASRLDLVLFRQLAVDIGPEFLHYDRDGIVGDLQAPHIGGVH